MERCTVKPLNKIGLRCFKINIFRFPQARNQGRNEDSATNDEIATATVSTRPNSLNSRPEVPGRNAMGTKTATNTMVAAMTAKKNRLSA